MNAAFAGYLVCTLWFSSGAAIGPVPVAVTPAEQNLGLAGLDDVGAGLLFAWTDDQVRTFWMHGTRVPLRVLFLDAGGRIFDLQKMAANSDARHASHGLAREALELPDGPRSASNVAVGDRLERRRCQ